METDISQTAKRTSSQVGRKVRYFLLLPVLAFVLISLALSFVVMRYQGRHNGRIYTGVTVWGLDVSQMTPEAAAQLLTEKLSYAQVSPIVFADPVTQQEWHKSTADLGLAFDIETTIAQAMEVGRTGGAVARFQEIFASWYYGRSIAPVLIFDEGQLEQVLDELAANINEPTVDATLYFEGDKTQYRPSKPGRQLDVADVRSRLQTPVFDWQPARIELLVHDIMPAIHDRGDEAYRIQQMMTGDVTFYLQTPLDDEDLEPVVLSQDVLQSWLRIELVQDGSVMTHRVFLDENAVRHWLSQYVEPLYRDPVNARFYFDDDTRELVLVAPHINGRRLDVEATIERILVELEGDTRTIPFVVEEIVPTVHAGVTAPELGITELITQTTTWFYGSSDARKHNIARAAANFFGIVVAPGEEFSFNNYLGSVSQADGYEEGLIIIGGRTIKGIGGGVCQVSTTLYQAAFLGGFPITSRYPHGYMLGYYNDGEGPGMDATVFSPLVDFQFINNTPHHLLIENYYNEENEALTFKFYSTSLGRKVVKEEPIFENIVPAPTEDVWEYDPDLPEGTVIQIDWATEGADVTVHRTVYNANGDILINEDVVSEYIPYPNVYHYGPGVEPYDYSLVPDN